MLKNLNDNELSSFSGQLAMILHSGISVLEGVTILTEDAPEGEGQDILKNVLENLEQSGILSESLEKSGCFPQYFIRMTDIGEKSGTLEEVMQSLSGYYGRQHFLLRSIRGALTYPMILLLMLSAVLTVLISQVMPVFEEVYQQLGMEVTGLTAAVFRAGRVMQWVFAALLIFFILAVAFVLFSLNRESGRAKLFSLIGKFSFAQKIETQLSCSRFSHALSLALHSGLDMGESFSLATALTEQPEIRKRLDKASSLLEEGGDFGDVLRTAGIFSSLNVRMVTIGFRTGSAETALADISKRCQEDADDQIQKAVSAIEPTMTAVLSILTGLILVSVMLPLLGVMANIG